MTTELVLLLVLAVFIMASLFDLPFRTFENAGPKLGARIERQIGTGQGFENNARAVKWEVPRGQVPGWWGDDQ